MSRQERILVDKIDRKREAPLIKAQRTQRAMFLRMEARKTLTALVGSLEAPEERAAILGDVIDIAAELRWPLIGRVETATGLNKVAADVCAVFRLPRAIKNAAAEQAFAKLTKAANDRGSDEHP